MPIWILCTAGKNNIIKIQSGLLEENLPQQNWAQSLHALCFTACAANGTRPPTASRRGLAVTWSNKTELFPQQTCWLLGAGGKRRCNINDGSLPVRWPSKPCQWASMDINEALALAQLKRNAAIINESLHLRLPWQNTLPGGRSVVRNVFSYTFWILLKHPRYISSCLSKSFVYTLPFWGQNLVLKKKRSIKKTTTWQQSRFPQTLSFLHASLK